MEERNDARRNGRKQESCLQRSGCLLVGGGLMGVGMLIGFVLGYYVYYVQPGRAQINQGKY